MSVLTYGPVRMQIQKTEHFHFAPHYTADGVDYLYTEVDFGVTAVVNQEALATLGPNVIAGQGQAFFDDAPARASGDTLGVSLRNLRPLLLAPRQNLTFAIGGDVVLSVSGPDAKLGPLVQPDTYVRAIMGTATAFIYFHVKCWVQEFVPSSSTSSRIVLANRYRVTSTLDENWYTTRHVSGQMIVDAGQLLAANNALGPDAALFPITPDSFRQAAFLQIPLGFKRQNVQVTVASDNTTLDYSYTDEETPLALGIASLATKVEGYTSVGADTGLAELGFITRAVGAAAARASDVVEGWGRQLEAAWDKWYNNVPTSGLNGGGPANPHREWFLTFAGGPPKLKANGIIRITGQRNANRADLLTLGINLLYNIFNTPARLFLLQSGVPRLASLFVTQDIAERFVEVRGTFVSTAYADWKTWFSSTAATVPRMMRFDSDLLSGDPIGGGIAAAPTGAANPLSGSIAAINPPPPFGGGTRGNWLGGLVAALLSQPGLLPVRAPDPTAVFDFGAFI